MVMYARLTLVLNSNKDIKVIIIMDIDVNHLLTMIFDILFSFNTRLIITVG